MPSGNVCYHADEYPFQGSREYVTSCVPTYKFAAMKFDQESGNYYTINRYYPPNVGSWLNPDPLAGDMANPQSLNRYAYALNSPATLTDPSGAEPPAGETYANWLRACSSNSECSMRMALIGAGAMPYGGSFGIGTVFVEDGVEVPANIALGQLEAGAAIQCPNNTCSAMLSGPNGVWLPMQYQAIWSGGYFSPSLSGEYSSANQAGTVAVAAIDPGSIATNTEFGGNIYRLPNGNYSFTLPIPGGPDSVDIPPNIPGSTVAAGDYHTHGAYDPNYYNEIFSSADISGNNGSQLPGYLGTPAGRVEVYNPSQAGQYPLGCVLVGSPVPGIPGVPACR